MKINPYDILGIRRSASKKDIKKAFNKKSKETHPDKNPDNVDKANADFVEVAIAYNILSDEYKRARFDSGQDPDFDPDVAAKNRTASKFREVLMKNLDNINHVNIIDLCIAEIDNDIDVGHKSNKQNLDHRAIIETFSKRLKKKEWEKKRIKQPLLEDVVAATLSEIDMNIKINEEQIELLKRSKEIFEGYSDDLKREEEVRFLNAEFFRVTTVSTSGF